MKADQPQRQLCSKPNLEPHFSLLLPYSTLTVQQPFFLENLADVHFITIFDCQESRGGQLNTGRERQTLSGPDSPSPSSSWEEILWTHRGKIRPLPWHDHSCSRSHWSAFTNLQIFNTFKLLVILYTDFSFYECKQIFSSVFCCFIWLILFLYDRINLSHAADICLQFLFAIYKSRRHHGHQGLQVEHERAKTKKRVSFPIWNLIT